MSYFSLFVNRFFYLNLDFPIRCEARTAWLCGVLLNETPPALFHVPSLLSEAKGWDSSARFSLAQEVHEKNFSGAISAGNRERRRKTSVAEKKAVH